MGTPRRRRRDRAPLKEIGTLANVPSTTGDISMSVEAMTIEPRHDEIARRAYELFEQRGGEHGHDWDDWFQAERELRQLALQNVIERSLATEGPYVAA